MLIAGRAGCGLQEPRSRVVTQLGAAWDLCPTGWPAAVLQGGPLGGCMLNPTQVYGPDESLRAGMGSGKFFHAIVKRGKINKRKTEHISVHFSMKRAVLERWRRGRQLSPLLFQNNFYAFCYKPPSNPLVHPRHEVILASKWSILFSLHCVLLHLCA